MPKNNANTNTSFGLVCQRICSFWILAVSFGIILFGSLSGLEPESDPVQLEMFVEHEHLPKGEPFWTLLRFDLQPGWHIYWKNPGAAGLAPEIEWQLPANFSVDEVLWPRPERYDLNGILSFGYEKEALLLAKIVPGHDVSGSHEIRAHVNWVACDAMTCLPGQVSVSQRIHFEDGRQPKDSPHQTLFEKAQNQIPQRSIVIEGKPTPDGVVLHVPGEAGLLSAAFFPYAESQVDHSHNTSIAYHPSKEGVYEVALKKTEDTDAVKSVNGVLVLSSNDSTIAYEIGIPALDDPHAYQGGIVWGLALAFLGGLLLNLMPCVLPVISFKVLSFVKMAGKSRGATFRYGLMFAFGVVVSFWVLAGTLLLLQSYGHAIGWGFQLQEPIFVGALAALIFLFAMSLFGVFELGTGIATKAGSLQSASSGLFGSFMSGVLATAVATPCTGPFLGTAVGFAVTLPTALAMLMFTFLALGMASPYVVLGAFPSLLKFLPKPGHWMVTFKELMGFLMLATVLWLVWVFESQTGSQALFLLLSSLFIFGLSAWIYGKWGSPARKKATRIAGCLLAGLFCCFGGYLLVFATKQPPEQIALNDALGTEWEPFSAERVQALKSQGIPVFVDFTAKWCLICQSNHLVLSSEPVRQRFDALGVVKMKADWTRRDASITEELKKFGRNSVPLYLLYTDQNTPTILPQVLTQEAILEALKD